MSLRDEVEALMKLGTAMSGNHTNHGPRGGMAPVAPPPDYAPIHAHLQAAHQYFEGQRAKYPKLPSQELGYTKTQENLDRGMMRVKQARAALDRNDLDAAGNSTDSAQQHAQFHNRLHGTEPGAQGGGEASGHLREARNHVDFHSMTPVERKYYGSPTSALYQQRVNKSEEELAKYGTPQGNRAAWAAGRGHWKGIAPGTRTPSTPSAQMPASSQAAIANGPTLPSGNQGVIPEAQASIDAQQAVGANRIASRDIPNRYTQGRRAELQIRAMDAKRRLNAVRMAQANRLTHLREMTVGQANAGVPITKEAHDVSQEARAQDGKWTSGSAHSMLRQQVGENLEDYKLKSGESRQRKVPVYQYTWGDTGQPVDDATIKEFEAFLKVAPGYTNLRINPNYKTDELQATATSPVGRPKYFYSLEHDQGAAASKFARLEEFNKALPGLMDSITRDVDASPHDTRVAARVLYLISKTGFRVGGAGDGLAATKAYGASTLLGKHAKVSGDAVTFDFIGKEGVKQHHIVHDQKLADIIKQEKVGPNERLFDTDDGKIRKYLKSIDGDFHPKDFRTWVATATALEEIAKRKGPAKDEATFKKWQKEVAEIACGILGNDVNQVIGSYINPKAWAPWRKPEWGEFVPPKLKNKESE